MYIEKNFRLKMDDPEKFWSIKILVILIRIITDSNQKILIRPFSTKIPINTIRLFSVYRKLK